MREGPGWPGPERRCPPMTPIQRRAVREGPGWPGPERQYPCVIRVRGVVESVI